MSIKTNLTEINLGIARLSQGITLVAVSKFQGEDKIIQAIEAGQRVFGENRVQEACAKWPGIRRLYPDIELHLIGALQTNKAPEAVSTFDVIESLDRPKLADCLYGEMQRQNRFLPCFIQVNIGSEPQKAGILPQDADGFIRYCTDKGLNIKGLMCIPPEGVNPEPYFKHMQELRQKHGLPFLSMGMSSDYAVAIKCGATHVRVGTAIFGGRSIV